MYIFHSLISFVVENECKVTLTMQMKGLVTQIWEPALQLIEID